MNEPFLPSREVTAIDLDAVPELVLSDSAVRIVALLRSGRPNTAGSALGRDLVAAQLQLSPAEAQRALNELGAAFGVRR